MASASEQPINAYLVLFYTVTFVSFESVGRSLSPWKACSPEAVTVRFRLQARGRARERV